jgi:tetratricopeptide (TPR) repeat protein
MRSPEVRKESRLDPHETLPRGRELSRALLGRPAAEVRALLDEIAGETDGATDGASNVLAFARAELALREGSLSDAERMFAECAAAFEAGGAIELAERAHVERAVALARRGKSELAREALARAKPLSETGSTPSVRVAATIAMGTAERVLGDAGAAQETLARAAELARGMPELKSQALNSLGTLCVVLGAYGAAEALLEHAAELARLRGDVIGEAIAMGQLGAAALGRGDPEAARRFLSRQEWLASTVGDAFGRTRALVWLSEVALDLERPDDAVEIAERARKSGQSVEPPLGTFIAYADRVTGRARLAMRDPSGKADLERARDAFAAQRLPLGEALCARDLALAKDPPDRGALTTSLAAIAALGTLDRVLEGLIRAGAEPRLELEVASALPRRTEPLEAALVHLAPAVLSGASRPRSATRKNLGRLAVLSFEAAPLVVMAVVAGDGATDGLGSFIDAPATRAAVVGQVAGLSLFAWSSSLPSATIAADVAGAMKALGREAPVRAAIAAPVDARVLGPGFGGALGARTQGIDAGALLGAALGAAPGRAVIVGAVPDALAHALTGAGVTA